MHKAGTDAGVKAIMINNLLVPTPEM